MGYVSAQLAHLHYRIVVAASGSDALAQIDEGLPFDPLFTDVIMLFTSGYTEDGLVSLAGSAQVAGFLAFDCRRDGTDPFTYGWIDRHAFGWASMANAQREWLAFGRRVGGRMLPGAAFALLLATASLAQDAGVSGIPLGPANINGQNNTGRDPSGIGNASKVAPLPEPSIHAAMPPPAAPLVSTQVGRAGMARPRFSHLSPRARRIAERAAVKEYDRLLKHGAVSICRGC